MFSPFCPLPPQTRRLEGDAGQQQRLPEAGGDEAHRGCEYEIMVTLGDFRAAGQREKETRTRHAVFYWIQTTVETHGMFSVP